MLILSETGFRCNINEWPKTNREVTSNLNNTPAPGSTFLTLLQDMEREKLCREELLNTNTKAEEREGSF